MSKEFTYYYNKLKEYSNSMNRLEEIEEDYRHEQKLAYDEMKLLVDIANFFENHL